MPRGNRPRPTGATSLRVDRTVRLEAEGYVTGYRAVLNPELTGRGFEVMVAVDINATDRQTVDDFEVAIVAFDEVLAVRRLFGQPDYLVHVAVADAVEYEAFLTGKLIGLPALSRTVSHQTMKRIKG